MKTELDIRKEVVIRRASQPVAGTANDGMVSQPPSSTHPSTENVKKKFGTQAEWLHSMGLNQSTLKSPRPPPSRAPHTALKSRRDKNAIKELEDDNRQAMMADDWRRESKRHPRRRKLKRVLPSLA